MDEKLGQPMTTLTGLALSLRGLGVTVSIQVFQPVLNVIFSPRDIRRSLILL